MTEIKPISYWQGNLQLTFAPLYGKTQIVRQYSQAPWKVQRPFYPEGGEVCHCVPIHTAGGMVGGDRLTVDWQLHPQARVLMTTAAASKIYRSRGATAYQVIAIDMGEGSCLEWLPQETIVFDGARYRQNLRLELALGATWFGWELTRFGRSARGEKFLSGDWRSHTEVWRQGFPLWLDRQSLPPGAALRESPGGLSGCPVVGTLAFVGQPVSGELVASIRDLWTLTGFSGTIGVTRLLEGLVCRYRGGSTQDARHWFLAVWQLLRPSYLERAACLPRVWL